MRLNCVGPEVYTIGMGEMKGGRECIRKQIQNYRYKVEYEYLFRMKKK